MVDLNAHETGNGGKKPREAYSPRGLLYSEVRHEQTSQRQMSRFAVTLWSMRVGRSESYCRKSLQPPTAAATKRCGTEW